jgi:23S rRNA (guanosine2251-2'-O)-methyltransferase
MAETEIFVKNPHSILEALKRRPKEVLQISLPRENTDGVWDAIIEFAENNKIRIQETAAADRSGGRRDKNNFKGALGGRESAHGALVRPKAAVSIESMLANVNESSRGVWLALDSLQDPQNLGAIFRSASFFGVKGIIMTTERSAPMSSVVYDISCGGVEAVPFVQAVNLQRAFEKAKDVGLWILGTSEHAKESVKKVDHDRGWLLVVGNEEKGIRRLTEEACDMMCTIPGEGKGVTSLNVSVATGVLLSHLC